MEPSCAKAGSAAHVRRRRRRRKDECAVIPPGVTLTPIVAQAQSGALQHSASLENSPIVSSLN